MKRIVMIMKKIISAISGAAVIASAIPASASGRGSEVFWQCTTEKSPWVSMGSLEATEAAPEGELTIFVDDTTRYQFLTDTPFGGCFNERGFMAMEKLSEEERDGIISDLFGSGGLRLTAGRLPIGNSDYSANRSQSYDELPDGVTEDYDLKYFSIENDGKYLFPYIETAKKYCPELKLWGSPWSPPSWMKNNSTIYGQHGDNTIRWTDEVLTAYAHYFAKYIKAYREAGHEIYMVMPQNEPTMDTAYASCVWTGEQLNVFIRDYLSPVLRAEGLKEVEIYLGTFTDSQANRCDPTLNDPVTSSLISGVGFQWWSAPLCKRVYRQGTSLSLMQSETRCGDGKNNWQYAEDQFDLMRDYFEAGVNSYMLWNMVLDEKGENTSPSPWHQNAPVIVNSLTNEISYSPQYYQFKHFSYYIDGGARRIFTSGTYGDKIAFQNPDGENVLIVKNSSASSLNVSISFNGKTINPTLPPHSVSTFTTAGDNTDFAASPDMAFMNGDEEEEEVKIKLHCKKGGMTLSVDGASFDNGADAISWSDQGTADQTWTMEATTDGYYRLINYNSLKCLGVYGGSLEENARCVQWDWDNSPNQQWKFEPVFFDGETCYKIVNRGSGLCLSFRGGSENAGVGAVQVAFTVSEAQYWSMTAVSGEPFCDRFCLKVSDLKREGNNISCTLTNKDGGMCVVYCAFYDEDGSLTDINSKELSFDNTTKIEFSASSDKSFAKASVYGWAKGLKPLAKCNRVK